MEQKFCIIIPVYKHTDHLLKNIAELSSYGLKIFIIDDGNLAEERLKLKSLTDQFNLTLISHDLNQGKGAAVYSGLKAANEAGFTHALQIDADGQHYFPDIPRFITASKANPDNLILGTPIFDNDAPKGRVWGRKLTNWIVAFESLSFSIQDALFGFRIYPIAQTLKYNPEQSIRKRMGFDVEVLLRSVWNGVKVVNIPTPVVYPKDGFSNFRYLEDNLNMIFMHSSLMLEAFFRFPQIILKKIIR